MGFLHRLRVAVWGVPPDTVAERRLLVKVDFFVLTYVCLMYWVSGHAIETFHPPTNSLPQVNYLDRANLNNAYVSGAREDLNFKGTQLNQINTIFYGYVNEGYNLISQSSFRINTGLSAGRASSTNFEARP